MTLVDLFNKTLKEIPSISKNLEFLIEIQGWDKEKKQQAITIVRQLQKGKLIEKKYDLGSDYIALTQLNLILSPAECNIKNAKTFGPQNIRQADQYMENLLTDINCISSDVKFFFRGHDYTKNTECRFMISWKF